MKCSKSTHRILRFPYCAGDVPYRCGPDGQATAITVRGGEGEGTGGGQAFPVHVRQQARVIGTETMTYDIQDAPSPDSWDSW